MKLGSQCRSVVSAMHANPIPIVPIRNSREAMSPIARSVDRGANHSRHQRSECFFLPATMFCRPVGHPLNQRFLAPDAEPRLLLVHSSGIKQAPFALRPSVSISVNVSAEILTVRGFDPLPSRCTWPPPSMASKSCQRNLASSETWQPIR